MWERDGPFARGLCSGVRSSELLCGRRILVAIRAALGVYHIIDFNLQRE